MINKIKRIISDNDINGLKDLSTQANEVAFNMSLNKGIRASGYFLSEYPEITNEDGSKEKKAGNPLDNDDFYFNHKEIEVLISGSCDPVTLFEAALIIGKMATDLPMGVAMKSDQLFCHALLNGEIDPRNPITGIPFSKCPKSKLFANDMPDMSWLIRLEDVVRFAILKGYDAGLFNDLLNDQSEINATKIPDNTNIKSPTYDQLMQSIKDFQSQLRELRKTDKNKKISIDNHIKPWVKKNGYTTNDRERDTFSRIIAEHYGIRNGKTPDR